jgi:pimeloyl-ACP methyl ester carboxylesterase
MSTLRNVLSGAPALATDATLGLIDLVEQMHATIGQHPGPLGPAHRASATGLTGVIYRVVRSAARVVGRGASLGVGAAAALIPVGEPDPGLEALVGVVNGVSGDLLERTANPLAIRMQLRRDGRPFDPATAAPGSVTGKLLLLVHGLCLTDRSWTRDGHDHGEALARDHGYTPLYLLYNSGRHISENGRAFADLLEQCTANWPVAVDEIAIIGHSMGGLVARSACHYGQLAGHSWLRNLRHLVFIGAPHHGAPLERGGRRLDVLLDASPYSAPFTRLGRARSAGITDLRHGYLRDEDWRGKDRFDDDGDPPLPMPLPAGVACFAVAAALGRRRGLLRDRLVGDGLVPVVSALGRDASPQRALALPVSHQWIAYETGHLELLGSQAVYARLSRWLGGRARSVSRTGRERG